jgi:hypothetical protein
VDETYIHGNTTILVVGKGNQWTATQVEDDDLSLGWKVNALDLTILLENSTSHVLGDFNTIMTSKMVVALKMQLDVGR